MNRIGPTFALAALLLAGCSGKKGETANVAANASAPPAAVAKAPANAAAPVVAEAKDAPRFEPGTWRNDFEFTNFYAPGIKDPVMAENMRRGFERQILSYKDRCMTPEEALHPSAAIFTDAADSGTCTYDRFTMRGGKIDATLSCIRDDGRPGPAMIVEGSYTHTSFDFRTITQMPNFASPRNPPMMVTAHVKAHRIGPCGK